MKLTIGLPCCNNFAEVWFSIQSLRLHHDLTDTEILVIDNGTDPAIREFILGWADKAVRYVKHSESIGPAGAKQRVFAEARGDWVICMDSHVLLAAGVLPVFRDWATCNPECLDLLHGPMLYDNLTLCADAMNDEWRGGMWGTWRNAHLDQLPKDPYEIPMHGMGLFACRRDAWLGFNPMFSGFGGEEGYIHTKYRQAGRRVLSLPFLRWSHFFRNTPPPYAVSTVDRISNYTIGLAELGVDSADMVAHFGLSSSVK